MKTKTKPHTCANPGAFHNRTCPACNPLVGVEELRAVVRWANGQPEYEHDNLTAEQVLNRFRKERDS